MPVGATADVLLVNDTIRDGVLIADAIHHALPGTQIEAVTGAEDALFYVFRARRFAQRDIGSPRLVLLDIQQSAKYWLALSVSTDGARLDVRCVRPDQRTLRRPTELRGRYLGRERIRRLTSHPDPMMH